MNNSNLEKISPLPQFAFQLRALVLALGECVKPPWWKTEFMSETGFRFLERIYPRTYLTAAVHAAGKAACDAHDSAVGRRNVFHLFRLPESVEIAIERELSATANEFLPVFRPALSQEDALLQLLIPLSSLDEKIPGAGAIRLGTDKDLLTLRGLAKTAGAYHCAFTIGKPSFPYFVADQAEEAE